MTLATTAIVISALARVRTIHSAPASLQDLTASLDLSIINAGIGMDAVVGGRVIDVVGLRPTTRARYALAHGPLYKRMSRRIRTRRARNPSSNGIGGRENLL